MEKLTNNFEKFKSAIKRIKNPLLIIHPQPDPDALGTALSLANFLKRKTGKMPTIFSVDKPNGSQANLFPLSYIKNDYCLKNHDALIFLDRGDIYYKLGFDKEVNELEKKPLIINIDHHRHTSIPEALNIIDSEAAATCEIIFRFFDYIDFRFDQKIAQFLLNGIYSDTGGFRHNNTTAQTLEIAAVLLKKGCSLGKINQALFANKSIKTLKLWSIALDRARINPKTGMVVSFITKQDLEKYDASENEISGISEILNTIAESNFSLVLSEREENKIKASLRSETHKGIDVSKIARQFQGGGHKLASGFEIKGNLIKKGDDWIIE